MKVSATLKLEVKKAKISHAHNPESPTPLKALTYIICSNALKQNSQLLSGLSSLNSGLTFTCVSALLYHFNSGRSERREIKHSSLLEALGVRGGMKEADTRYVHYQQHHAGNHTGLVSLLPTASSKSMYLI